MGLKEQKSVNAIGKQNKPGSGRKPPADSVLMWTLHKVPPTWPIIMHGMTYAMDVGRKDTGKPNAEVDTRHLNSTTKGEGGTRGSMK